MPNLSMNFEDKATGTRWYRDPKNPSKTYPGMSGVLGVARKGALEQAKINGVAMYAARHRKDIVTMNQADAYQLLRSIDKVLSDWAIGSAYGTQVHQVVENLVDGVAAEFQVKHVKGSEKYPVSNSWADWIPPLWADFVARYKVVVLESEKTVVSDVHRVAGRFDLLVEMELPDAPGERFTAIVDVKSNRKGPMPGVAVQNKGYASCESIMELDGTRRPMPIIQRSFVLWLHESPELSDGPAYDVCELRFDEAMLKLFKAHLTIFYAQMVEGSFIGPSSNPPESFKRWQAW